MRTYRQQDVTTPHFRVPFQFGSINGGAYMNEQDTIEDYIDCIKTILAFPVGSLESNPEFGVPDVLFKENMGSIPEELKDAITFWEDRTNVDLDGAESLDLDALVLNLQMNVGEPGD